MFGMKGRRIEHQDAIIDSYRDIVVKLTMERDKVRRENLEALVVSKTVAPSGLDRLPRHAMMFLADQIAKGADLVAASVTNEAELGAYTEKFNRWRDETWDAVRESMGPAVDKAYRSLGLFEMPFDPEAYRRTFMAPDGRIKHDDYGREMLDGADTRHQKYRRMLAIYIDRLRFLMAQRGL